MQIRRNTIRKGNSVSIEQRRQRSSSRETDSSDVGYSAFSSVFSATYDRYVLLFFTRLITPLSLVGVRRQFHLVSLVFLEIIFTLLAARIRVSALPFVRRLSTAPRGRTRLRGGARFQIMDAGLIRDLSTRFDTVESVHTVACSRQTC